MATTTGTTFPMAPMHPGGDGANKSLVIPIDTSMTEMRNGDIVVYENSTGYAKTNNDADGRTAEHVIIGVAMLPGTGEVSVLATPDPEVQPGLNTAGTISVLNVALALPGALFAGNTGDNVTDQVGVVSADLRLLTNVVESADGYAACDITSTGGANTCFTLEYTSPQWDSQASPNLWRHGRNAGVGNTNPRVKFVFVAEATVFGSSLPIT